MQLLDYIFQQYQEYPTIDIVLEIIAVVLGIASVWYAKKERILVFPTGIISTVIFVYLLFKWTLYGDMIVNVYYTIMSLYGWYQWKNPGQSKELEITRATRSDWMKVLGIFISTVVLVIVVYLWRDRFDRWTDYVDTFTTGLFFSGMWLMANKKIENWHFWIVADLISIPLYFYKGFAFTAIQYIVFLILAILALNEWKKTYNKRIQMS